MFLISGSFASSEFPLFLRVTHSLITFFMINDRKNMANTIDNPTSMDTMYSAGVPSVLLSYHSVSLADMLNLVLILQGGL